MRGVTRLRSGAGSPPRRGGGARRRTTSVAFPLLRCRSISRIVERREHWSSHRCGTRSSSEYTGCTRRARTRRLEQAECARAREPRAPPRAAPVAAQGGEHERCRSTIAPVVQLCLARWVRHARKLPSPPPRPRSALPPTVSEVALSAAVGTACRPLQARCRSEWARWHDTCVDQFLSSTMLCPTATVMLLTMTMDQWRIGLNRRESREGLSRVGTAVCADSRVAHRADSIG
jgi:hypothetical protein